jgi:exonuclease I
MTGCFNCAASRKCWISSIVATDGAHLRAFFGGAALCRCGFALAWHPRNRNALIVCDLHLDPQPLLDLDAESLRQRFTPVAMISRR